MKQQARSYREELIKGLFINDEDRIKVALDLASSSLVSLQKMFFVTLLTFQDKSKVYNRCSLLHVIF